MAYPPPYPGYPSAPSAPSGYPSPYPSYPPQQSVYPSPYPTYPPQQPIYPSPYPPNPSAYPAYPSTGPYCQPTGCRRYQIRHKIFSFGDKFTIKDEQEREVFNVRGKVFSLGRNLSLEDMAGNGLIKIQQELLHLHRTYKISSARAGDFDRQLAVVTENFSLFHETFNIESVYGHYSIEGLDITNHAFVIRKQGQIVATISKKFFSIADVYGVEVSANEDQAFILALTIVIDQVLAEKDQNRQNSLHPHHSPHHHHHSPHHHHHSPHHHHHSPHHHHHH